jgi:hypothetical protein
MAKPDVTIPSDTTPPAELVLDDLHRHSRR